MHISCINMHLLLAFILCLIMQSCALQQTNFKTSSREKRDSKHRTGTSKDPYIITSIFNKPFLMQTDDGSYEGFVPDFAKHLAHALNFSYELVPAKKYGASMKGEKWDGMIGDIVNMDADFAIADLTITSARQSAVDFTSPYMTSGIGILMAKEVSTEIPSVMTHWDFLAPFGSHVWRNAFIALAVLSLCLFILGRCSPADWTINEQTGSTQRINQFTISNTMFYLFGALAGQNTQLAARGLATRLLSITWWIFCFFVAAMYIANLAAILVLRLDVGYYGPKIQSVEDLAAQSAIKYGTLKSGSTHSFFKTSTVPLYERIYSTMESTKPTVFVDSYDDGVKKVRDGNFALFMEATSIEYLTERDCELEQIGGLLDYKGYGIAMKKGSLFRYHFDHAILRAQESGFLRTLKDKWFKPETPLECEDDDKSANDKDIAVLNFAGIFTLLIIGVSLSFVVGLLEMIWRAYFASKLQGGTILDELKREGRNAVFGAVTPNKDSNNVRREDASLQRQDH